MRKKKHGEERLSACSEFLADKPCGTSARPVYLEIGAGKGGFAVGMCQKHPEVDYYAMEKVTDCVVLAAERAKALAESGVPMGNLKFIIGNADNLMTLFEKDSVDSLFLNFSDPWSKKGYAKRRLTHARYLSVYFNLLKEGGALTFKTDNVGLFDFSIEQIRSIGLECEVISRDLHSSEYMADNVVTEYESNFAAMGVKINMLRVRRPKGFYIPVDEELVTGRRNFPQPQEN
jgi:tRNA (guanine-N7-)-methyltransferase